ncbi:MAG: DUF6320 domain-containing protein [Bacilli bacterium]|nr:DUF6320 domain-containing protein [Bacilli bacterium]MDD4077458.1 DUF6320 domain-containing protein [Bacilli bacterium]MDD4388477.1 DUF6320 domain-containing protein [Bacilli bacterium]
MKKCTECKVLVNTERKTCPLCFTLLRNLEAQSTQLTLYPKYRSKTVRYNIFFRILAFLSIVTVFVSVSINIINYRENRNFWSLIIVASLIYLWILFRSTIRGNGNIPRRLIIQMLTLSVLLYVIDRLSGYGRWSLDFVIPFLSMASLLSIIILLVGNTVKFQDYVSALFAAIIFGFIPFILWLFKIVSTLWPSLSAASLSFSTIIGMFIFAGGHIKEELKKRFHI